MNASDACARFDAVTARPAADLSDFLHVLAARHGERVAIAGERHTLTFAALDCAADAWSAALAAAACGRGTHVGLLAGNEAEWLAVAFSTWRAGATLVPISTFVTARELGETLTHADIEVLVVQPRLRGINFLDLLGRSTLPPRLRQVVVLGDAPPPYRTAMEFLATPAPARAADVIDAESVACILYTSGTTGRPKGVMLSHRAILATVYPTAERSGLSDKDTLLSTLPLFWVAGLVIRALPTLAAGCALLLVPTFTTDAVLAALQRHHPTALHLRPPQVGQVFAHPGFSPDLLANVHRGNGRVGWYAPYLDCERARFITGYGMTEMAGYVTALHWEDPAEARRAQIGAPLPGVTIRIVDAQGHECPAGTVGEIRVRGPGMFSGYYKQPADTGRDREGFFVTGDLGCVDADGTFHFVGRSKDLLRVKGINVSPLEVEAVLGAHPGVEAVYVVGLPVDGLDQRLVALVVANPDTAPATENDLRMLAREALSHYKRPATYIFIARHDVPLSGTSKPQRAALARLATVHLT